MAEDIHCKFYIKSKVGKKKDNYVSAMEIMSTFDTDESSDEFTSLFNFRCYDFFSMLGSRRSDWRLFKNINDGLPDWFEKRFPTEYKMLFLRIHNYYRFGWTTFGQFREALVDRIRQLSDIKTYYAEDPDEDIREDAKDFFRKAKKSPKLKNTAKMLQDDADGIKAICTEILQKMDKIKDGYSDEEWRKVFDVDDTVILFWFDN